jgi:hypothetical protein
MNINVAVSIDLMTSPEGFGAIDVPAIKHICLVGNNRAMVQGVNDALILRSGRFGRVSKDGINIFMVRDARRRAPHHEVIEVVAMRRYWIKLKDITASC